MINKKLYNFSYELIKLRYCQILINNLITQKKIFVPIHLALGHEAIAIALRSIMNRKDIIFCTHRNIHYNLAFAKTNTIKSVINEYLLKKNGLNQGKLGSMNLYNLKNKVLYSSSILGNSLSIATGYSLSNSFKKNKNIVIVATGDGAIEEGLFWESVLFAATQKLKIFFIVENNNWSLSSTIKSRRRDLNLKLLTKSIGGIGYSKLNSNNVLEYKEKLSLLKNETVKDSKPQIIEVICETLGSYNVKFKNKTKFVNYHHGPVRNLSINNKSIINKNKTDPIYVISKLLKKHFENLDNNISGRVLKIYEK